MIVFAVISLLPTHPELEKAVVREFKGNHIKIAEWSWLVAGNGTAQEIALRLGVGAGGMGSAIIFSTAGYYGRAPTNIWEWIRAKLEAPVNG